MVDTVDDKEILLFIEKNNLMGHGLGLIDIHLFASAVLNDVLLWTLDKQLKDESSKIGVDYKY